MKQKKIEKTFLDGFEKQIEKHVENVKYYKKKELFENALDAIEFALILSPKSISFQLEKSEILIELKEFKESLKVSGNILKTFPKNSDALFLRGKAYYYQGMLKKSSNLLLLALQFNGDNLTCLQFRKKIKKIEKLKQEGNELFQKGFLRKSYEKYTDAIKIDANASNLNSQIFCDKSEVAMKMNEFNMAKNDAIIAIDLNSKNVNAYIRRAIANEKLENFEEAILDLSTAKELDPKNKILKELQDKMLGINANEVEVVVNDDFSSIVDEEETKDSEKRTFSFDVLGEENSTEFDTNESMEIESEHFHIEPNINDSITDESEISVEPISIPSLPEHDFDSFEDESNIGKGAEGFVRKATDKISKEIFAFKHIKIKNSSHEEDLVQMVI